MKGKGKSKVANHEVPGKASVKVDVPAAPELVKTESNVTQLYEPKDCVLILFRKKWFFYSYVLDSVLKPSNCTKTTLDIKRHCKKRH